ncbi:MAG: hypothetical protein GY903_14385 [Fuerstiella sp.]|nr:hypothetical protein [Fuerstiella sp.]MCP4855673.1 hypothetical protein [Fuerstiella sp.]
MSRIFNPISSFDETWRPQRFSSGGIVHELRFRTVDDHYCRVLCQELIERTRTPNDSGNIAANGLTLPDVLQVIVGMAGPFAPVDVLL